jgi:ribonuclease-3
MKSGKTEDYKTLLQKFVQQAKGDILEYEVISESGPSHSKTFEIQVKLNNNVIGGGFGSSKREAEQQAAKQALILFGEISE